MDFLKTFQYKTFSILFFISLLFSYVYAQNDVKFGQTDTLKNRIQGAQKLLCIRKFSQDIQMKSEAQEIDLNSGEYSVIGDFYFWDKLQNNHLPIKGCNVELLDIWFGIPVHIAWSVTDEFGHFEFVTDDNGYPLKNSDEADTRDICVKIFSEIPSIVRVSSNLLGNVVGIAYNATTEISENIPDGIIDIGSWLITDERRGCWNITNSIYDEYKWFEKATGFVRPFIGILWPWGEWPGFEPPYNNAFNIGYIQMCNGSEWRRVSALHEYAHAIMFELYGEKFPPHNVDNYPDYDNNGRKEHVVFSETDRGLAFIEGWADFIQCAIDGDKLLAQTPLNYDWNGDKIIDDVFPFYAYDNIEENDWWKGEDHIGDPNKKDGAIVEGSVASIFWDIFDEQENDDDDIQNKFNKLWLILKYDKPDDIIQFWNYWVKGGNSHNALGFEKELWEIFYNYGINTDNDIEPPTILSFNDDGEFLDSETVDYEVWVYGSDPLGWKLNIAYGWGTPTESPRSIYRKYNDVARTYYGKPIRLKYYIPHQEIKRKMSSNITALWWKYEAIDLDGDWNNDASSTGWSEWILGGELKDDDTQGPSVISYWDSGDSPPGTYQFKIKLSDPSGILDNNDYPRIFYRWDSRNIDGNTNNGYLNANWDGHWYTASFDVGADKAGRTLYWRCLALDDDNDRDDDRTLSWSPVYLGGVIEGGNIVPDFLFDPKPSPQVQNIKPGENGTYTVYLKSLNGFNSQVNLSISDISPAPTSGSISGVFLPNPVTPPKSSTLNLLVSNNINPRTTYTVTVKGVGGGKERTTTVSVHVPTEADPILSATPTDIDLGTHQAGYNFSKNFNVTNRGGGTLEGTISATKDWITLIDPNHFDNILQNQTKNIKIAGVFPSSIGPFEAEIHIASNGGNQVIFLHGIVEGPAPDFLFDPKPSPQVQTIKAGENGTFTVYLKSLNGFNSPVNLSISDISPAPTSGSISDVFSPNPVIPPKSSSLNISVSNNINPRTTYTLMIKGVGEGKERYTNVSVQVPPDEQQPTLCVNPTSISVSCAKGENPPSQFFNVWNCGHGTLYYQISSAENWLDVNPTTGTSTGEKDRINVSCKANTLSEGEYNGIIRIINSEHTNDEIEIPVSLTISGESHFVYWEAENGVLEPPMQIFYSSEAYNNQFVQVPEQNSVLDDQGTVNFSFWVPTSGEFRMWCRIFAPDGLSNSFWVSLDNQNEWQWRISDMKRWLWRKVTNYLAGNRQVILNLSSDRIHNIQIRNREDGTRMDAIYLSNGANPSFPSETDEKKWVRLKNPNGGEALSGITRVQWEESGFESSVFNLKYTNNDGQSWSTLKSYCTGHEAVLCLPNMTLNNFILRVTPNQFPFLNDISDGYLSIDTYQPHSQYLEAEHGALSMPMEIGRDGNAYNNAFVHVPELGTERNDVGDLSFLFTVPYSGNYVIWGRIRGLDGTANSYYVKIDEGTEYYWQTDKSNKWIWDKVSEQGHSAAGKMPEFDPVIFNLESNKVHILQIRNREDGTRIDALYMSNHLLDSDDLPKSFPYINLTSPATPLEVSSNEQVKIEWTKYNVAGPVRIEFTTDMGIRWEVIANNVYGDSYLWNVPNIETNTCLIRVSDNNGSIISDVCEEFITIRKAMLSADFKADPRGGERPLRVRFQNLSTGIINNYYWDFGDGSNSSQKNPVHIFNQVGSYDISLTVSGSAGSRTERKDDYIEVYEPLIADFTCNPQSGCCPLTVRFRDNSSGEINSRHWIFGDGFTSTVKNPEHVYEVPGIYSVTYIVKGENTSDTCFVSSCITVDDCGSIPVDSVYTVKLKDIVIDGNFEDWAGIEKIATEQNMHNNIPKTDIDGSMMLAWNGSDRFYIGFRVSDDDVVRTTNQNSFANDPNGTAGISSYWLNDCIEAVFSREPKRGDAFKIVVAPDEVKRTLYQAQNVKLHNWIDWGVLNPLTAPHGDRSPKSPPVCYTRIKKSGKTWEGEIAIHVMGIPSENNPYRVLLSVNDVDIVGSRSTRHHANSTGGDEGPWNILENKFSAMPKLKFITGFNNPLVTTKEATEISETSAVLNGSVNPNGQRVQLKFEYGKTKAYGSEIACTPGTASGNNIVVVNARLINLVPNTTYHFRIVGLYGQKIIYGNDKTFTTVNQPVITTNEATNIVERSAVLNGMVNPNGHSVQLKFEYGRTKAYGDEITCNPSTVSGENLVAVSAKLSNLASNTTYHFRIVGTYGQKVIYGVDKTFTTLGQPVVTTNEATEVAAMSAMLNGLVDPNGHSVQLKFEYGETQRYDREMVCIPATVSGENLVVVRTKLENLVPNTTYHYRIVGIYGQRIIYGLDKTFSTLLKPVVITKKATNVSEQSAVLNGSINPNGLVVELKFEYGKTREFEYEIICEPSKVNGDNPVDVRVKVSNLIPNTFYHYRLVGGYGDKVVAGQEMSFNTLESTGISERVFSGKLPDSFVLGQNYPNPFNPITTIPYGLPERAHVTINILNIRGELIKSLLIEQLQPEGYYKVPWDGSDNEGRKVTSGVYIYHMHAKGFSSGKKMLYMR